MNVESFNELPLDKQVKLAINSKSTKMLDIIANSNCDYAKIFVARNKYASFKTLSKLAKCGCRSVVDAALNNPILKKAS